MNEAKAARQGSLQGQALTKATAQQLQHLEAANRQILERNGSFNLIHPGDRITIPGH
jgi:hypothetical protein